jgi:hypothetical protein
VDNVGARRGTMGSAGAQVRTHVGPAEVVARGNVNGVGTRTPTGSAGLSVEAPITPNVHATIGANVTNIGGSGERGVDAAPSDGRGPNWDVNAGIGGRF